MSQTSATPPQPRPSPSMPPLPSASPANPAPAAKPGPTPPIPGAAEESEHYQPVVSFWHRKWVVVGMPIATSALFHIGLIVAAVILAYAFKAVWYPPTQQQTVIPDGKFANNKAGGVLFSGVNSDPLHQMFQDKDANHGSNKGFSDVASKNLNPSAAAGGGHGDSDGLIATGGGSGFGIGHGNGGGKGNHSGSGTGEGGELAAFGHPGGGGLGPHGNVFGDGGDALRIAFVCDASGSMMEKMEALKKELSATVHQLQPFQEFSITFFQNEKASFIDKNLIPADAEDERKADEFLADVSTSGSTNPIYGLDVAFAQKPDLVYLLTDGDFDVVGNDKVLEEIHKLNPGNKIKINTIAFTNSADHDVDFKKLLKQIADETHGTFKPVNEEDLDD